MTMTPDELATQKMFTRIERELGEIRTSTDRTEKAIFGNGQPGLIERVAKLETKVGVIAGLAGFFASVIAEVVKHLF